MKKTRLIMNKFMVATLLASYIAGAAPALVTAIDVSTEQLSEEVVVDQEEEEKGTEEHALTSTEDQIEEGGQSVDGKETAQATESQAISANQTETQVSSQVKSEEVNKAQDEKEAVVPKEQKLAENAEEADVPVQILGFNDFHGAISTTGSAYLDVSYKNTGTAAYLAAELDQATANFKAQYSSENSIRIQAGDLVGASPSNSALLQDEPTIKIANRLGIQYGILGNHEFDEGLTEFNRILTGQKPTPGSVQDTEIINAYPREASNMTILSANIIDKTTGQTPFGYAPYAIHELNGAKVGFIGVVTSEIPNLVLAQHTRDYNFIDPAQAIVDNAKELRKQGVNAIVVIGHTGVSGVDAAISGETVDIIQKAKELDPENSVDIFFAGHSHSYANGVVEGVRVIQSTSQGKAFANVIGEIDPETQDFSEVPSGVVAPTLTDKSTPEASSLTPNAEIKEIVSDADERIESMVNEVIGKTADGQSISREVNNDSDQESALGNLITDAQLYMARKTMKDNEGKALPIDFAMTNNGGIRADLAVNDQGEITWGAAQAVQPFGNVMQVVAIKGSDLIDALNQQFNEYYFLQIAGLKYTYTGEKTADGDSRQVKEITIIDEDGKEKAFDETATYHVVINDFLLGGGDGFEAFTRAKLIGALDPDTDIFVNYIKEKQEVSAKVEGRKTAAEAAGEKSLTILGSTDVHGNIWDFSYEDNAQANVGIAKIAGYAEQVRTEVGAENVVLIDNGDIVQGTILTDDLYNTDKELKKEPNPVIAAMNVAGYDSMTLGNHEFNFGQDLIKKIVKEADFPILSANTYVTETEENLVGSYTIVEKDGIKVAILGLTIPDIPLWDGPRVENLTFNGLQAEAEKQVEKIEIEEQPDVIIASIHAGLDNSNTASAARNVIENVTGIDAFIIGHDHKTIANKMPDVEGNEKPVGASKDTGSEISRIDLDLVYDEATGEWVVNDSDVQSVSMADVTASQAVKDATQAAHDETLKFISEPIGQASANFLPKEEIKGIPEAQMQPTALISLINNVQLEATGADVSAAALFKADSRLDKGDITYANIFDIYKYANTLVGVEITGKNLRAFMEDNARYYNQYQDGDLTVSFGGPGEIDSKIRVYNYDMFAGIDYQIDVSKPVGERIINPTIKGQAIKDDQVYKLAVNNYRLGGLQEKGYVTATPYFDTDPKTLRGMIAEYIKAREVIDPAEELSDNWEIIGAPGLTHFLRPVLAEGVNTGVLTVEATPNNRTPNITTLTIQDLIEADLVGKLDLASLEKVIETAHKLKEKDFTAESWSEFQTVLTEIERVLADAVKVNEQLGDDARADEGQAQAIINEKAQQLDEAIKALITTGGEGQTGDILVLTDLEQAVKEAKQLEEANYTAKTWANFVPVRDEASKVLEAAQKQNDAQQVKVSSIFSFVLKEDQVLTQAQIDEVTQTLTAAMKQLVAVNKKPHGNNQNNGGTTKPNSKPQSKFPSTGEKVADYAIIGLIVVAGTGGAYYVVNRKKAA